MFCSIFKFQGVVALFLQTSRQKWQRGLLCGVLPAVMRSGSLSLLKGLLASGRHCLQPGVPGAQPGPECACLLLCRMALTIMVFVNYGGGKYWYFKHSSWNGEPCPEVTWLTRAPPEPWVEAPAMRPLGWHLRPLPQPSVPASLLCTLAPQCFPVTPEVCGGRCGRPVGSAEGVRTWVFQARLVPQPHGCSALRRLVLLGTPWIRGL